MRVLAATAHPPIRAPTNQRLITTMMTQPKTTAANQPVPGGFDPSAVLESLDA
jgi:hypothetical protein